MKSVWRRIVQLANLPPYSETHVPRYFMITTQMSFMSWDQKSCPTLESYLP